MHTISDLLKTASSPLTHESAQWLHPPTLCRNIPVRRGRFDPDPTSGTTLDTEPFPHRGAVAVRKAVVTWRTRTGDRGRDRTAAGSVRELGAGLAGPVSPDTELLLLSATTAPLGRELSETLGIPALGAYLQPAEPTGEFAPVVGGARSLGRWGGREGGRADGRRGRAEAVLRAVESVGG